MEYYVYVTACAAVMCITTYLIFHADYEDGIIGRLALVMMALPSAIVVMECIETWGKIYPIYKTTVLGQCGVAVFFARHIYRFYRWRKTGEHTWRPANK